MPCAEDIHGPYNSRKTWKRSIFKKTSGKAWKSRGTLVIFSGTWEDSGIDCNQPWHIFVCSDVQETVIF